LVCAVADEGFEFGDPFEENVAYLVDDGGGLLAARQGFGEAGVYAVDFEEVAKDGANEFFAAGGRDNVALAQGDYPELPPRNHGLANARIQKCRINGVHGVIHLADTRYP